MKENIIIALLLILIALFSILILATPKALEVAVADSMKSYLEIAGYATE